MYIQLSQHTSAQNSLLSLPVLLLDGVLSTSVTLPAGDALQQLSNFYLWNLTSSEEVKFGRMKLESNAHRGKTSY